jgi:hypothetical protein
MSNSAFAAKIAKMLIEHSKTIPACEFGPFLERVFQDACTSDVAAVADCMPAHLQGLLPRKYLH